jgi:hypothetical protein
MNHPEKRGPPAKNWLSRRAGWKETQVHQIEGGDRGPELLRSISATKREVKSDTPILENMAEACKTVARSGLVRETLAGTLSRWKERGFYVDVSSTQELLSDPNELTKEQAEDCLAYAKSAITKLLK